MEVSLTDFELRMTADVGVAQFEYAQATNREPGLGPSRFNRTPENHIRGVRTEFAASVILNLSWRPNVGVLDAIDVGGLVNVRSTLLDQGRLIIKPKDIEKTPLVPFVLMRMMGEKFYRFLGWRIAGNAPQLTPLIDRYGDPGYFLEQAQLFDIDALREFIRLWGSPQISPAPYRHMNAGHAEQLQQHPDHDHHHQQDQQHIDYSGNGGRQRDQFDQFGRRPIDDADDDERDDDADDGADHGSPP